MALRVSLGPIRVKIGSLRFDDQPTQAVAAEGGAAAERAEPRRLTEPVDCPKIVA